METLKWRDFEVDWCKFCRETCFICSQCKNTSCFGCECSHCLENYLEWKKSKYYKMKEEEFNKKIVEKNKVE